MNGRRLRSSGIAGDGLAPRRAGVGSAGLAGGREGRGGWVRGAALLSLGLASACVSERPDPAGPVEPGADCVVPVGLGGAIVPISDFRFVPDTIRVPAGESVAWVNCDPAPIEPHTTTADAGGWDSGALDPPSAGGAGGTFVEDFPEAGTFRYHCTVHPFMTGVVLVE